MRRALVTVALALTACTAGWSITATTALAASGPNGPAGCCVQ